jgi:DNA-binding FadR family transcriptional regulator
MINPKTFRFSVNQKYCSYARSEKLTVEYKYDYEIHDFFVQYTKNSVLTGISDGVRKNHQTKSISVG